MTDDHPWDFEEEYAKNARILRGELRSALEPTFGDRTDEYVEPIAEIAARYAGRMRTTWERERRQRIKRDQ